MLPLPGLPRASAGAAGLVPPVITAQAVLPNTGNPTAAHLRYAEELRGAIPAACKAAARKRWARALCLCAVVERRRRGAPQAVRELAAATSPAICQETLRLWPDVQAAAMHAKLFAGDLALPGLRQMSPGQFSNSARR